MGSQGERRSRRSGEETRARILDAVLDTVRSEGLVGTSTRAIARTGDFNQALVFYHFGSMEELLLAALQRANRRRIERFRDRLADVDTLAGLVEIAIDMQRDDAEGDQSALTAIVAGWPTKSDVGKRIVEILRPWDELVEVALQRSLAGTPLAQLVPTEDAAHGIACLFLGIEMMGRLDPDDERTDSLFSSLLGGARLAGSFIDSGHQQPPG